MLSRPDLLRYLAEGRLQIDPPVTAEQVAQVSIDLSTPLRELELHGTGEQDSFQYQTDPIPYREKPR